VVVLGRGGGSQDLLDHKQKGGNMPIDFLQDRHRAQRLGRVRLGIKKISKSGKEYPVATSYFILNDAAALKAYYGEQPAILNIEFLWDSLEHTFPHYMRRYTAKGLRCLGDGNMILYRVNDQGDVDVRDGNAVYPNGKVVMDENDQPVKVHCPGDLCPQYEDGSCKPTGYLRFLPVEAPRLGYYDLVCHQRAVVGILTQLKLTIGIFHHLTGIPFILHRGEEEKVPVKVPGKGMVDMPIRTQWIEIEPGWFAENWMQREKHKALAAARVRQDILELFGEDSNGEHLVVPPTIDDLAEPIYEGEGTVISVPDEVEAEPNSNLLVEELHVIRRDVEAIKHLGDLYTATRADFNLSRDQTLAEAGVKRQEDLTDTPREIYLKIAAVRGVTIIPPEG